MIGLLLFSVTDLNELVNFSVRTPTNNTLDSFSKKTFVFQVRGVSKLLVTPVYIYIAGSFISALIALEQNFFKR